MRYPDARDFPGLIMWAGSARGPIAPPGRYQVRLTAQRRRRRRRSSRSSATPTCRRVTDADLVEQFALARQINDKVTAANEAVLRIRSLKEQIAARTDGESPTRGSRPPAQSLTEKLTDVEGEIYQYRNRSNQDPLNYPIRLNNKLAALQGIVESGDAKPTDQSYAVFKELSARLDKELATARRAREGRCARLQSAADRTETGSRSRTACRRLGRDSVTTTPRPARP